MNIKIRLPIELTQVDPNYVGTFYTMGVDCIVFVNSFAFISGKDDWVMEKWKNMNTLLYNNIPVDKEGYMEALDFVCSDEFEREVRRAFIDVGYFNEISFSNSNSCLISLEEFCSSDISAFDLIPDDLLSARTTWELLGEFTREYWSM